MCPTQLTVLTRASASSASRSPGLVLDHRRSPMVSSTSRLGPRLSDDGPGRRPLTCRGPEPRVRPALRPSQPARSTASQPGTAQVYRDQVRDGAAILSFLMPVFVDVMIDHPGEDWRPSLLSGPGRESPVARARLSSPAALERAVWSPRCRRERALLPGAGQSLPAPGRAARRAIRAIA